VTAGAFRQPLPVPGAESGNRCRFRCWSPGGDPSGLPQGQTGMGRDRRLYDVASTRKLHVKPRRAGRYLAVKFDPFAELTAADRGLGLDQHVAGIERVFDARCQSGRCCLVLLNNLLGEIAQREIALRARDERCSTVQHLLVPSQSDRCSKQRGRDKTKRRQGPMSRRRCRLCGSGSQIAVSGGSSFVGSIQLGLAPERNGVAEHVLRWRKLSRLHHPIDGADRAVAIARL
jgi:hypothetical protein